MKLFASRTGLAAALALFASTALPGCSSAIDGGIAEPAVSADSALRIDAAGVAGINAATPYSEASVEAVLPGYAASGVTMATEDRTVAALAVFKDGLQVIQVLPGADGRVGAVHGVSASLRGPGGTRIGMSLAEARIPRAACRAGTGNWLGMPICTVPTAPNVSLVFAVPGVVDGEGLPDDATLGTATLQRIIWTAEGGPIT